MYEVSNRKILFVEDDETLLNEMADYFYAKGNKSFTAETLKEAKELFSKEQFDAVVLDVILPDGNGLELFETGLPTPPVVILSDLGDEENVMAGLASGATDYVVKPCSMPLLEMRLSLRLLPLQNSRIEINGLSINTKSRTCDFNGVSISLTSSEFNILHFLMKNAGKYFTASEIYENVWKAPSLKTTTIKRHLSTLRRKLTETARNKKLILTDFGKGYAFNGENSW